MFSNVAALLAIGKKAAFFEFFPLFQNPHKTRKHKNTLFTHLVAYIARPFYSSKKKKKKTNSR
jgi:hypothetical protein